MNQVKFYSISNKRLKEIASILKEENRTLVKTQYIDGLELEDIVKELIRARKKLGNLAESGRLQRFAKA